ncbi:carbohydrate ABC transporter permease [Ruminiclostridium cellobioparum]|uniref:carbohydrate ABC transporter permease n=1 Tax=Ruminiclostridium cellobioparum TaxID=29355 RepID=UPI000A40F896|nr:sugar ABC transporter permease [Ruminiclostridium cellobioparum]
MPSKNQTEIVKRKLSRDQRSKVTAILLLMPAVIFLLGLIAYPLVKVVFDSFSYSHLINKTLSGFAGLNNFKKVVSDEHFTQALINTVVWTVFSVLGEYVLGLGSAVLLNQDIKGRTVFRIFIFIPWLVPIIVAGMTWSWILNPDFGILNNLLVNFHFIKTPINFLGDKNIAMASVIFINIWRSFPYYTISILAALQSIPSDIQEAASIDGAGMFKRFFKITLPQLKSVSLVLVFIHIIWTSINFDFIWILTQGGPNYATETLPLMIYRYSMKLFDVGAASALSTIMIIFMTVLFVFYYKKRSQLSESAM